MSHTMASLLSPIKILSVIFLALGVGPIAFSQTQFPPCPEAGAKDKCWGQGADFYGRTYVGEFKVGIPAGRGTSTWANGEQYVGEHSGGKRDGFGVNTYPNSERYVGWWKNDAANGEGILYGASGAILQNGNWENGRFTGPLTNMALNEVVSTSSAGPVNAAIAGKCPTQIQPIIPREAMWDGIGGHVKAQAKIMGGEVVEVLILSGPLMFHEAVRSAMMAYKCSNSSAEDIVTQEFNFKIGQASIRLPRTEAEYVQQLKVANAARIPIAASIPTAPIVIAPSEPPAPARPAQNRNDIGVVCPTQVPPEMPRKAIQDETEGTVRAQMRVRDGVVQDVVIISGPRVFHAAVKAAVMQYKCISDFAGDFVATQEFNFRLTSRPTIVDILKGFFK